MQFFTKDEHGEFHEATNEQMNELFHNRFERFTKKETARIQSEFEENFARELEEKHRAAFEKTIRAELEREYQPKLEAEQHQRAELEVSLRRKTIAAEYGFSPETEGFLGNGDEDDMRQKADILKKNFQTPHAVHAPEKTTDKKASSSGFVRIV